MAKEQVSAKLSGETDEQAVSVNFDFGDNLQDAVQKFGEEAVFNAFRQQSRVNLQSLIRRHKQNGDDAKTIQKAADEWKPGQVKPKRSKAERLQEDISNLSEEEKNEILKKLKG